MIDNSNRHHYISVLTAEDRPQHQDSIMSQPSEEPITNEISFQQQEIADVDGNQHEISREVSGHTDGSESLDVAVSDGENSNQLESVRQRFVERSETYDLPQLERLYTRIMKGIFGIKKKGTKEEPKTAILRYLLKFLEDEANF